MPVSAETLRLLMDAGVEGDELLRIVESIDRTPTKERSANAERQARHRAKKAAEIVTNNVTESVTPRVRVEDNLQTKEITGKGRKKTAREDEADFVAAISPILDAERIESLCAVRRKKGATFSAHAGRLLSKALSACPNVAEAADEMVLRNWTGVKPEWMEKRNNGPPGRRMNAVEANLSRRIQKIEPASGRRNHGDAELLPTDGPGLPGFVGDLAKSLTWRG